MGLSPDAVRGLRGKQPWAITNHEKAFEGTKFKKTCADCSAAGSKVKQDSEGKPRLACSKAGAIPEDITEAEAEQCHKAGRVGPRPKKRGRRK